MRQLPWMRKWSANALLFTDKDTPKSLPDFIHDKWRQQFTLKVRKT